MSDIRGELFAAVKRRYRVARTPNMTPDEKREIDVVLRGYRQAVKAGAVVEPRRLSFGEWAVAKRPPEASVADLVGPERGRLRDQAEEVAAAHEEEMHAVALRSATPAPAHLVPYEEEINLRKARIEAIETTWKTLLGLRRTVKGEVALRRLMHPWIAFCVDVLVFLADFLFFWETLRKALDYPWKWSGDSLIGIPATFLLAVVGPCLVVVSAATIGRMTALRRAERQIAELGLYPAAMMSHALGQQVASSSTPSKSRLRRAFAWVSASAPKEWVGLMYLSGVVLIVVAAIYASTLPVRLELAKSTSGGVADNLWVLGVLLLLLPLGSLIAHIASSNHLRDALEEVEARLDVARAKLQKAKRAKMEHEEHVEQQGVHLDRNVSRARNSWLGAWTTLNETVGYVDAFVTERRRRHSEHRADMLAHGRAIIEEMPLYPDEASASSAAHTGELAEPAPRSNLELAVVNWAERREDLDAFLAGAHEALLRHRPPAVVDMATRRSAHG